MLVIVFGQAVGGGVIDAYTAKKVLPRILVAAVMINLSFYLVALAVDITNLAGRGIFDLLTSVVSDGGGSTGITLNNTTSGLGIAGIVGGVFAAATLGAALLQFMLLFVLVPAFFAFLGVVFVLILRRGIIMLLVIVSPVAFALYCLPNTEKFFKQWWGLLFKTLLVYPIIAALFGVAKILSVTINQANGDSSPGQIISLVVLVIPMFLIPYSFKLAGGAIGQIHGQLTGMGKKAHQGILGNENDPHSNRSRAKRGLSAKYTQRRIGAVRANVGSKSMLRRGFGKSLDFGNLKAKEAMHNAEAQKINQAIKDSGDDTDGRAITSIPLYLDANGRRTTSKTDASGQAHARAYNANGRAIRTSLAGKEFTDDQYKKSQSLMKTNGDKQYWMDYEATKINEGETENYKNNYLQWAQQEGFSDSEIQGIYTGVAFSEQNKFRNLKYSAIVPDGKGGHQFADVSAAKMNYNPATGTKGNNDNMVDDLYNNTGAYATGMLSAEDMNRVFDMRDHYASVVKNELASGAQPTEGSVLRNAQDKLAKIGSLQTNWAGSMAQTGLPGPGVPPGTPPPAGPPPPVVVPPTTPGGQPQPQYGGLSGGNQGIQDTFKARAFDQTGTLDVVDWRTGR
jgi:YD repeat-containing protein